MPKRYVFLAFHIDTNRINAKSRLKHMNILEHWHENDVIFIDMAEVAQNEAARSRSSTRTQKAYSYIFSETLAGTPEEKSMVMQISDILFPDGVKTQNEKKDVEIVFNAYKYGRILITDDGGSKRQPGGIIGNREKLSSLGIKVLRDYEAVELVTQKIIERDQRVRKMISLTGNSLPEWIGSDLKILEK